MTMVNMITLEVKGELVQKGNVWYYTQNGRTVKVPLALTQQQALKQCAYHYNVIPQ